MKKVITMLAVAGLVGATALAIVAFAGAAPDKGHGDKHPGKAKGKGKAKPAGKAERVLFASLNGRNEIGADGRKGAGDPDGRGGFTALIADDQVCFGLTVDNVDPPVMAHIHRGKPSRNGPIVITLIPPSSGDPGASSGCVSPDGGATGVLQEILKHPNHFYANVHTGPFPEGAVRGQLKHRRP
jgi:hypothetical protein